MVTDRLLCLARAVSILIALSAARAQFTPATGSPFASGANPVSVAVGDFNNDLIPDLAIANLNDKSVTVLLGTGMGGFMQAKGSPITVGTNPTSVAVADFNGDGFQDLAIANFGDGTITVLLGNGTGAFVPDPAQASPINVPHPAFIAAGNFNGNMGLAVANEVENTVTVLLGDGKGGFTPASSMPYNVGTRPVSLAIAPLTLAGIPDLAIANLDSGNITVLLGDGKGGFTPDTAEPSGAFPDPAAPLGTTPQVPGSPISVAILDVNHDSYPDLVIANEAANNITVLLGSATGGFTPATDSPIQVGSRRPRTARSRWDRNRFPWRRETSTRMALWISPSSIIRTEQSPSCWATRKAGSFQRPEVPTRWERCLTPWWSRTSTGMASPISPLLTRAAIA